MLLVLDLIYSYTLQTLWHFFRSFVKIFYLSCFLFLRPVLSDERTTNVPTTNTNIIKETIVSIVSSYWIISYIVGYINTPRNQNLWDFLCFFVKIFEFILVDSDGRPQPLRRGGWYSVHILI